MKKKLFALTLALLLAVGVLCSCVPDKGKGDYSVWSTYNTVKVIRQSSTNDKYVKQDARLNYEMMKNETEGAQLIVTAGTDVGSFDLQASDLHSADGKVLSKDNFTVYQQKYVTISRNYNGGSTFHAGDSIPDVLLPLDVAKSHNENVINAGENQGITVEVSSQGVQAGTYTGEFTLTVDGTTQSIPVSVTVWDIEYDLRRTFMSSFLIYCDEMVYGEYNNSKQMIDSYIDFLAKYKVDTYAVRDSYEAEHFTESLTRFDNDNNVASIVIPVDFPLSYVASKGNSHFEETYRYIKEMALASTEETCYVEYAYFYPSTYDEADIIPERQQPSEKFFAEDGEYAKTLQLCVKLLHDDVTYMQKSASLRNRIESAILKIPAVFTNVGYVEKWVNNLYATFCPYVSEINDYANRQRYLDMAEQHANGDFWLYSCNATNYPYPTFDIDDDSLGLRVNGWLCKEYGVTGYLYYEVDRYSVMFGDTPNAYIDVFGDPNRGTDANGDGYVLYPGSYYGLDTPLPSLRLATYRDSMDDFDMLCVLENKLAELSQKYGTSIDFNSYIQDLYVQLYNGSITYENIDGKFYDVRRELANRILALDNEDQFVATYTNEISAGKVHLFANKSQISVDGKQIAGTPSGQGYEFVINHNDGLAHKYEIVIGNNKYSYSVNGYKVVSTQNVQLSTGSVKTGNEIVIKSIGGRYSATSMPYISIVVSNLPQSKTLRFSYSNTGNEEIKMQINLVVNGSIVNVASNYCPSDTARQVEIALDGDIDWSGVTAVQITFKNVDSSGALLPDKTLTISDLWFDLV